MTTLTIDDSATKATSARLTEDTLAVDLADGRSVSVPLAWYPRLMHGSPTERANFRMIAGGEGIHWEDLDEDISVAGILAGRSSGESSKSLQRWLDSRCPSKDTGK